MKTIESFIWQQDKNQQEILRYFHTLFSIELNLTSKIRFKIPFYYNKSWVCYLNPLKDDKVELAFLRGNELSNAHGLLAFKGRKQVAGVEIDSVQDLPLEQIKEIIQEAILLDDIKPYRSKRTKT